jgi:hypothetical protein|tara:strand:- start:1433 stop:1711 length:279 start_codon:yes stop_codon:yes gene_type:complete
MANNGKGIGPNRLGASKGSISSPAKQKMETSEPTEPSPQKNFLGKGGDKPSSPAKKNGMKYDIKEASNQSLSASARKNYAENAQHDSKKGYR